MWVWIESKNDTIDDKSKIEMIKNVLSSVQGGYKGTAQDFNNLITMLGRVFETNKQIDVSAEAVKSVKS